MQDVSHRAKLFDFGKGSSEPRIYVGLGHEDRGSARRIELAVDNNPVAQVSGLLYTVEEMLESRWVHVAVTVTSAVRLPVVAVVRFCCAVDAHVYVCVSVTRPRLWTPTRNASPTRQRSRALRPFFGTAT